ncbi:DUF6284 family protein [Streptomyces rimosus]|uniref:DUF6284 family protein n=1 Tax=Streptomyces rimosus TaxID=1927 RepID=UPI00099B9811|nr:DUF6284 family protein [Streptomyces rimosus]
MNIPTPNHAMAADLAAQEPSAADLAAIEAEMPVIVAEVELLDAQIAALDAPATEVAGRRIRRACRKLLAARLSLVNQGEPVPEVA